MFQRRSPRQEEIPLTTLNDDEVVVQERTWFKQYQKGARSFGLGESTNQFEPNLVRNQKYTLMSFLPMVLYEQFKFFFNLYFLVVSLSQLIKSLQIGYLISYFGPLGFVLVVTIGKEAYDDLKRYQRDKEANAQIYTRLIPEGQEQVPSSQLLVGDILLIEKNTKIPADCVLLRSSDPSGTVFIRTDQLDGETDWKLRVAVPTSQKMTDDGLFHAVANVYCEAPHKDIHTFVGNITWIEDNASRVDGLSAENMLWMNTVLASGTATCCIVYTGRETRAVMNTSFPSTKVGQVDMEINNLTKALAFVTLVMSLVMVGLDGFGTLWYVYTIRFLILFSNIIPISLRVNLEMGKTLYSYMIMQDDKIPGTIVRTSTIPEELGRIDYLFTDKTGTLTKNEMVMKKLHMGTISFGGDSMDEIQNYLEEAISSLHEESFSIRRKRGIGNRVFDLVMALGLCHNVTPNWDANKVSYQASSPDEIAIVQWTEEMGLQLVYRDQNTIKLQSKSTIFEFEILNIFPFTSELKRMGIIVRNKANGQIVFYQKGADAIMAKIVMFNHWLDEECGNMAREGLRTLVIGRKLLSNEKYEQFVTKLNAAKTLVHDRQNQIQLLVERYLERDLELLGLTGVEDKLQDDIKPTFELLRNAGLRIWMLTGDKIETAKNISISSKLVARNQHIYEISGCTSVSVGQDHLKHLQDSHDTCLIIDGVSLQTMMDHLVKEFVELSIRLPVVACCRCSPTQKAEVVRLIKKYTGKRTCAIGDGGNDVSMIQMADVGIGIVGKEGMQASLAADFSITQFSFISRLFLWHGRNSYKRSSKLGHFVIHRGLIISVIQAVFSSLFYFAPIAIYQGIILVGYTTLYTMAPVFSLVYDLDINEETALLYPELYKELTKGRTLSFKTFCIWLFISVYQGGAIMILAIWLFENEFVRIVSISFTALILNELLMVALEITTWHRYMVYAQLFSLGVYIASMWLLPHYFDLKFISSFAFIWKTGLITGVSSVPLYLYKYVSFQFNPPNYTKLEG
ncbi:hypothetical protein EDD86DRAFT_190542 [Gorgonomyces haynaldii]|nr:hypothetical protein EDD86DRAFT_190542 [Gorgonomyces haynaldii]